MKNLHLIATDKPSRLHKIGNELGLTDTPNSNFLAKQQNIFITSDEEIKEGDWALDLCEDLGLKNQPFKVDKATLKFANQECEKIILTTDQDLINDGVQAIDDEFLEWFVKNPSCDYVDVENAGPGFPAGIYFINYLPEHFTQEITISKEESKQEALTYTKAAKKEEKIFNSTMMKQETLKEASENYANMHQDVSANLGKPLVKGVFEDGAAWQAERMYSQDEILMAMGYAIGVSGRGSLSHEEVKASCIDFVERLNKK